MLYSNSTDKMKWLKFWFFFLFVPGITFCVIGVILWIIVGGVVANPPYGSKCCQRGKCIHNNYTQMQGKTKHQCWDTTVSLHATEKSYYVSHV